MINKDSFDPEVYEFYRQKLEGPGFAMTFSAKDVPLMRRAEILGHTLNMEPYEVHEKIDLTIPREGAGSLPVRIYIPEGAADAAGQVPVILYFHGGGFIMGSIEDHDPLCGKLADTACAIVIAAEYRLAPEDPFPACIEDAVFLAEWASENAAAYGGDPDRIMAGGDSSGATISAALALLGRDGKAPAISGLILLYGVFGCISLEESESARLYGQGEYILPVDAIDTMMSLYVPEGTDLNDIRLNPGRAADLSGMPPSVIVTAEFDPLRDDGECFARRLKESGCKAELIRMDGMMHGFALYWHRFSKAKTMLDRIGSIVNGWTK
jgi:acetyl esterase